MNNKQLRLAVAVLCGAVCGAGEAAAVTTGPWRSASGLPYVEFTIAANAKGQPALVFIRGIGAAYCTGKAVIQPGGLPLPIAAVVGPANAPIVNNEVAFSSATDPFLQDVYSAMSGTIQFTSDTTADLTLRVYAPLYSGPQHPPNRLVSKICSTQTLHLSAQPRTGPN